MHASPDTDLTEDLQRLARKIAPVIRFDANEPFLPSAVGISLIAEPGPAVAAPRRIAFRSPSAPMAQI